MITTPASGGSASGSTKRYDLPLSRRLETRRTKTSHHQPSTLFLPSNSTPQGSAPKVFQDGIPIHHAVPPHDRAGAPAGSRRTLPAPRGTRLSDGRDEFDGSGIRGGGRAAADEGDEGAECYQEAVRTLQGEKRISRPGDMDCGWMGLVWLADLRMGGQIVRRKGGKRHNGYLYVICKSNPRHKQRQG